MGTLNITIKNYDSIITELKKTTSRGEKIVNRTIGDFKSRGPGWVSQEVVKEYNIKKSDVNEHKKDAKNKGSIKVRGVKLDNIQIIYKGRVLTPTHFGMKPKTRPKKGPYIVTAQIKKNEPRKSLGQSVFLAKAGGEGTTQIPWQRDGNVKRLPVLVVKTLSVQQMITNEKVSEGIYSRINEEMGKRLAHNMERIMKK